MTTKRIIELLEIEHRCMVRGACNECNRDCGHCNLVQDDKELDEMYKNAIITMKKYEMLKKRYETLTDTCSILLRELKLKFIPCSKCKHCVDVDENGYCQCDKNETHEADWFCADGELK